MTQDKAGIKVNDSVADLITESRVLDSDGAAEDALLGMKLREIRNQQGWTLKALAEKSKLNINTLSLIEKGKSSPSIGTLQRIAKTLDVPIISFFDSGKIPKKVNFTSHDQRPATSCCKAIIHNLSKDLRSSTLEPFVVVMPKDAGSGGRSLIHKGYEFAYCLRGKIRYWVQETDYRMVEGDSLVFSAQLPHRWENIDEGESQLLLVLTPADLHEEQGKTHFHENEGE